MKEKGYKVSGYVKPGDLVCYMDSTSAKVDGRNTRCKFPIYGIWDGKKVIFSEVKFFCEHHGVNKASDLSQDEREALLEMIKHELEQQGYTSFWSDMRKKAQDAADKEGAVSSVKIGDKFTLGIGFGESALFEVTKFKKTLPHDELSAVLEAVDVGAPSQSYSVSYLESLK